MTRRYAVRLTPPNGEYYYICGDFGDPRSEVPSASLVSHSVGSAWLTDDLTWAIAVAMDEGGRVVEVCDGVARAVTS